MPRTRRLIGAPASRSRARMSPIPSAVRRARRTSPASTRTTTTSSASIRLRAGTAGFDAPRVPAGLARARRLRDGAHREVPERLRRRGAGRPPPAGPSGTARSDHSTYRMWGLQDRRERRAPHLRPQSTRPGLLPDGRADQEGRGRYQAAGGRAAPSSCRWPSSRRTTSRAPCRTLTGHLVRAGAPSPRRMRNEPLPRPRELQRGGRLGQALVPAQLEPPLDAAAR